MVDFIYAEPQLNGTALLLNLRLKSKVLDVPFTIPREHKGDLEMI